MDDPRTTRTHCAEFADLLRSLNPESGARASCLPGVTLLRSNQSCPPVPVLYEPCIVIVAEGRKLFHLPDHTLDYDTSRYLVVTVPVPAGCGTEVGPSGLFLGLAVHIDLNTLSDLLLTMESAGLLRDLPKTTQHPARGSAPPLTSDLSEVSLRLARTLTCAAEAAILGPQLIRELLFRVACGPAGPSLRDLVLGDDSRTRIYRVLQDLHRNVAAPLDVAALAHRIAMSTSALHLHFRAVTGTSPVQYLQTLRLHRGRQLMVQHSLPAAIAADRVGYASPSQFSREFKRLFGVPPAEEASRVRAAFGYTDQVSAL